MATGPVAGQIKSACCLVFKANIRSVNSGQCPNQIVIIVVVGILISISKGDCSCEFSRRHGVLSVV